MLITRNKVKPSSSSVSTSNISDTNFSIGQPGELDEQSKAAKEAGDLDSLTTIGFEDSSYLKLKPFTKLDPTLERLMAFLTCFGLTINIDKSIRQEKRMTIPENNRSDRVKRYLRFLFMVVVGLISAEVVYDVNLRHSKLLVEQKRSTPLLTFVIIAHCWMTLVIPTVCDLSLTLMGSNLFRFYSRTTATVCNGMFFGKKTSVDRWYYYVIVVIIAFLDVVGQVVLVGVWPDSIDPYMKMILMQDTNSTSASYNSANMNAMNMESQPEMSGTTVDMNSQVDTSKRVIKTFLIDSILGPKYAHGDLGVCVKVLCLMIQLIHSNAFLMIIISFSNHYANAINNINENLDKYEFRQLLRQLIILRDSNEQISLMISLPFSLITASVFMRQIALNGVFIQSTMLPYENWAVSLQTFTCFISIFMVFIYCDGLQSASKQTHRLKTEQTVIHENKGGNQSMYEFLDYLDRLSKSIRITFFNIISINKGSLIGLYGHILTLTFVTS